MYGPRLFDVDPALLQREIFVPSSDGKTFQIVQQQNVGPVLAENKAQRNDAPKSQFNHSSGFTKVASIPLVVINQLREDGILGDQEALRAWLNKSDNKVFRTRGGRV